MRILITGGAGFVGSHLCEKYVKEDHTVICLDNFMNGNLVNIRGLLNYENFKLITGDVRDFDLLEKIISRVDVIMHLAAQIHTDRSIVEPKITYDINILGTQNILELAKFYDIKKIIYASTSEVYGTAEYTPMDELHPLNPSHPYGASKLAADRMCYAYKKTYGLPICIMRPFNTYGPRQKDNGYGSVISIFTRRVLSNKNPIIFGNGNQVIDYVYIEDVVRAYDAVLKSQSLLDGIFNFGTGIGITINDLANIIIGKCDRQDTLTLSHTDPRPGEVDKLICNAKKAQDILGWKTQYSIQVGLSIFIDWYSNYSMEGWENPL